MQKLAPEILLKKHGLRVTQTRLDVLKLFLVEKVAVSNQDIERQLPGLDRITLYRTLKSFENKGVIHKAVDGTETSRFALCHEECTESSHHHHHVHFHCEKCENTFCVDTIQIPTIRSPKGFEVHSTDVILNGLCEKCT